MTKGEFIRLPLIAALDDDIPLVARVFGEYGEQDCEITRVNYENATGEALLVLVIGDPTP